MFKRKNKDEAFIENKAQLRKNISDIKYIQDILLNVYDNQELSIELDLIIEDLAYLNPSDKPEALEHFNRLDEHLDDVKRLFGKYTLELNKREYLKLLKKIKLEIYQRKNI